MNEIKNKDTYKIHFKLPIIEDGYPPISVEILNAKRGMHNEEFVIDNSPFFAESIALGDIVKCSKCEDTKNLIFKKVLTPSGNSSISIIFIDNSCIGKVKKFLEDNDCFFEYGDFPEFKMYAVNINYDQSYRSVRSFLDELEEDNLLSYAELCLAQPYQEGECE